MDNFTEMYQQEGFSAEGTAEMAINQEAQLQMNHEQNDQTIGLKNSKSQLSETNEYTKTNAEKMKKLKVCKTIQVKKLIVGRANPRFVPNQYLRLKFDRPKRVIELIGFKDSPSGQAEQSFHSSAKPENQKEAKEFQFKYIIKKQNLKLVELSSKLGFVKIQFKQAVMYEYERNIWIPSEILNNSMIRLSLFHNEAQRERKQDQSEDKNDVNIFSIQKNQPQALKTEEKLSHNPFLKNHHTNLKQCQFNFQISSLQDSIPKNI